MYRFLRNLALVLLVFVFLLALPAFALAQEQPSPAEPTLTPFLQGLVDYINQGTFIAEIAVLALILTQLLKFWVIDRVYRNPDGSPRIPSAVLHVSVQVLLWGGHVVALHFGYGEQYLNFGAQLGAFLNGIRDVLIPATASVVIADLAYKKLHAAKVSGFRFEPQRKAA